MLRNNWRSEVIALGIALAAPAVATAQARPVESLRWFTGCWERRTPTLHTQEQWSLPTGGMLVGFAKTTVRDSLREFEFMRVYAVGDTLVYSAQPSGQAPAEFRAVPPYDSAVTFSNPAHDFPQRVIYRRAGTDSLRARIEGTIDGKPRGVDFAYARASCK